MTAADIADEVKKCLEDCLSKYHYFEPGKIADVQVTPQSHYSEKNVISQSKINRTTLYIKISTYQASPEQDDLQEWEV